MKALILAAGMASRLRPLTDNCPKCLLKVGGRTLLERTVDNIMAAGISGLVVVTGYREEMIRTFLTEKYPQLDIKFIYNKDYTTTNNIYSLWLAREEVAGKEFLLLDSDILFDGEIIKRLFAAAGSTLALNSHKLGEEEIKVILDENKLVKEISKTCSIESAVGESVGIEKMTAEYSEALFKELETMIEGEGQDNVFYEKAFERLIPKGYRFGVTDISDLFSMELDTVEDFDGAKKLLLKEME